MLVNGQALPKLISELLSDRISKVTIVSAFLKQELLQDFSPSLEKVDLKIYSRWHSLDLIRGVSDLECYPLTKKLGGDFYINSKLHAKLILVDNKLILGSSNYTLSGTGRANQNIEWNWQPPVQLNQEQLAEIEKSLAYSTKLDDQLFSEINKSVEVQTELREKLRELPKTPYKRFDSPVKADAPEAKFRLQDLPPFSPQESRFGKDYQIDYLNRFKVHGKDEIRACQELLFNRNPLTRIVLGLLTQERAQEKIRWGDIWDLIWDHQEVFSPSFSDKYDLQPELETHKRLRNWMEWFCALNPQYNFWVNENEEGNRQGTCSINQNSN